MTRRLEGRAPVWDDCPAPTRCLDCIAYLSIFGVITDEQKHQLLLVLDEREDEARQARLQQGVTRG